MHSVFIGVRSKSCLCLLLLHLALKKHVPPKSLNEQTLTPQFNLSFIRKARAQLVKLSDLSNPWYTRQAQLERLSTIILGKERELGQV